MKQAEGIEILYNNLPLSTQIKDLDLETDPRGLYFTWRGNKIKIELETRSVYTLDRGCLVGCDMSILIRELLFRREN